MKVLIITDASAAHFVGHLTIAQADVSSFGVDRASSYRVAVDADAARYLGQSLVEMARAYKPAGEEKPNPPGPTADKNDPAEFTPAGHDFERPHALDTGLRTRFFDLQRDLKVAGLSPDRAAEVALKLLDL